MLKQNEDLPDIEKLGRHEFDLDIEEQNRLQAEADAEVNRVGDLPKRSFSHILIVLIENFRKIQNMNVPLVFTLICNK